jgi:hypothetical protein
METVRSKERRRHKRFVVRCPITLSTQDGEVLCRTRTGNISDGGTYLALPPEVLPSVGTWLSLRLSVPRDTPNTYMLEEFAGPALIVRHQPADGNQQIGVGLKFIRPMDLMLEV